MSRTWKRFGIAVLALSLFVVVGARAADEVKRSDGKTTIEDLQKDLKNLKEDLRSLNGQLKGIFEDVAKDINGLKQDINTLKPLTNTSLRLTDLEDAIAKTNKRIDRLQDSVAEIDRAVRANSARVARAFEPPAPLAATTGTIRMVNRSGVPANVILAGVDYALGPYDTRSVSRPAGPFSYEVFATGFGRIFASAPEPLRPNEVCSIEINPPR